MKNASAKSQASRRKIVAAAGRAFRQHGLDGIGVDGLAKNAHLTSGAFYFHFPSKLDVFVESVRAGLDELREAVYSAQTTEGDSWLSMFASFYMGSKRTCDLGEGCTLPALSSEVERAGAEARTVYEQKLLEIANAIARGLGGETKANRDQAWVVLALLVGGVTMARTVRHKTVSKEIAAAIERAVLSTPTGGSSRFR